MSIWCIFVVAFNNVIANSMCWWLLVDFSGCEWLLVVIGGFWW